MIYGTRIPENVTVLIALRSVLSVIIALSPYLLLLIHKNETVIFDFESVLNVFMYII